MASNPVYIEAEEEISEVIERLRRSSSSDIPLVLPAHSRLGQSRFNFQLLKQYSGQLGKRVSIISADPAVQRMAEENGFRTFPAVDQYGLDANDEPETPIAAVAPFSASPIEGPPPAIRPFSRPLAPVAEPPRIITRPPTRLASNDFRPAGPSRLLLYVGAGILLVVGMVAMALYIPSAQVTLVADAKPLVVDAIDVPAAPGQPPIRVRAVSASKTASQSAKATGVKVVPGTIASGTAVYTNNCQFGLLIPGGQRLQARSNGSLFAQQGDTEVKKGGTASVPVIAAGPGAAFNVATGDIAGIQGNTFDCLTVSNPGPTSGGADEQKLPQITQGDFTAVAGALEQQLRKEVTADLAKQAQPGEKLADQLQVAPADVSGDHKVQDTVSSFTLTMTLRAEGALYFADDVVKAFGERLDRKLPTDEVRTDNKVKAEYAIAAASAGGHLDFKGKATAFVGPKLDYERIKSKLVGKSVNQATGDLKRLPIRSAAIKQSPFKLPFMPLLNSRIDLRYEVDQRQPQAA